MTWALTRRRGRGQSMRLGRTGETEQTGVAPGPVGSSQGRRCCSQGVQLETLLGVGSLCTRRCPEPRAQDDIECSHAGTPGTLPSLPLLQPLLLLFLCPPWQVAQALPPNRLCSFWLAVVLQHVGEGGHSSCQLTVKRDAVPASAAAALQNRGG